MDRVALFAFLGIQVLVDIHAGDVMFSAYGQTGNRLLHSPQQTIPAYFVVEQTAERRA